MIITHVVDVVAVLLTATLAGNELAVAAFVHPAMWRATDRTHVEAAARLARILGRAMPIWYAATLVGLGLATWCRPAGSAAWWACLASAVVMAGTIVFTIVGLVPINNRVATWVAGEPPPDWRADRRRWDRMHAARVAVLLCITVVITAVTTA